MPSVLVICAAGAEEIEFCTVPDILVRAGCAVIIAGVAGSGLVAGSRGVPIGATVALDDVMDRAVDAVYVPGGTACARTCREDHRVQHVISRQLQKKRWLATVCAATSALIPGGHARGRRLTSFPSVRDELVAAGATWIDAPVVMDRNLITSQSAGTTMALALSLASCLCGAQVAETVALQILAPACVRAAIPVHGV